MDLRTSRVRIIEMGFKIEAMKIRQGRRTAYVGSMSMEEANRVLPRRPEDQYDTITETNRAIDTRHVDRIVEYVGTREDWYLPSVVLSVPESSVRFTDGALDIDDGLLILDGQHRRLAIERRIRILSESGRDDELAEFESSALPFCIVVESDRQSARQMFADMANGKSIDKLTRLEFDSTDPFNNVSRRVCEESRMLKGRIHPTKGTTVKGGDEYFMTKLDVKTMVTILQLGLGRNPTMGLKKHYRTDEREIEMVGLGLVFLDDFLPEARALFEEVIEGDRLMLGIKRIDNWELEPVMIEFLAGVFNQWTGGGDEDWKPLASYIRGLDMSRQDVRRLAPALRDGIDRSGDKAVRLLPVRDPVWRGVADGVCRAARGEMGLEMRGDERR